MRGLPSGTIVGEGYRIERELGCGSTGTVYKAMDLALRRSVALKLPQGWVGDMEERLREEAAALASLRHDHVVGVYAFGHYDGAPYMAMEFVEGRSLAELIEEFYEIHETPVPLFHAIQVLRDLADGLSAVHGAGIVHRDVKPDNVIIERRTGRVVLVDFGAAVMAVGDYDGPVMGTPLYLAPEAQQGAAPDPVLDIYALGCVAYELLTGRTPYEARGVSAVLAAHASAPIPALSSFRRGLEPLDDLLRKAIAKDPGQRLSSAAVFANLLEERQSELTAIPQAEDSVQVVLDRPGGGVRILVVDDDTMFAKLAARCARMAMIGTNAQVARASTGAKALANIRGRRPDIIVLDYLLPDMDGVEVLSRVRAGTDGHHPEVIVASGAMGAAEQWRFGILGVQHFVAKPVEFTDLLGVIHRVASSRGWARPEQEGGSG